jgi:hypothetical protein
MIQAWIGVISGSFPSRPRRLFRDEKPVAYWIKFVFYVGLGLGALYLSYSMFMGLIPIFGEAQG